jgi:hypothetical protein
MYDIRMQNSHLCSITLLPRVQVYDNSLTHLDFSLLRRTSICASAAQTSHFAELAKRRVGRVGRAGRHRRVLFDEISGSCSLFGPKPAFGLLALIVMEVVCRSEAVEKVAEVDKAVQACGMF